MVTELIRTVNHFTGKFKQPIKLQILTAGADEHSSVDVDSLAVICFMRIV